MYTSCCFLHAYTLTHTHTHTHTFSLLIPGADSEIRETYSDLLPEPPCIIDPVNPSNNVYLSGVNRDEHNPDHRWATFAQEIDSLDLTGGLPIIRLLPQSFEF